MESKRSKKIGPARAEQTLRQMVEEAGAAARAAQARVAAAQLRTSDLLDAAFLKALGEMATAQERAVRCDAALKEVAAGRLSSWLPLLAAFGVRVSDPARAAGALGRLADGVSAAADTAGVRAAARTAMGSDPTAARVAESQARNLAIRCRLAALAALYDATAPQRAALQRAAR